MTLDASRLAALDAALSFLGPALVHDHPIGPLTTYRVGGDAARFVLVEQPDQLVAIADAVASVGLGDDEVLVIGRGSNLLVADGGISALVLQLGSGFEHIDIDLGSSPPLVRAGSAVSLPVLARRSVAAGVTGLEWTVGVPGSVGGAVRMNAGGHGSEVADCLSRVRLVDLRSGEDVEMNAADLGLRYRHSNLAAHQVVMEAEFRVEAASEGSDGAAVLSEIVRWRREHQPGGQNAGSVFTNPPDDSAGRLIDAAGCKGLRVGTAEVSPKHANFIQADPGGSADDVVALMSEVVQRVRTHSGVRLVPETVMVGFEATWH